MTPQFSEFTYGYALTETLIDSFGRSGLQAAPLFPSLLQEGKLGFDLGLKFAEYLLFIQFKLSHYIHQNGARAHRKRLLGLPYYQFALRSSRNSRQHDLLLRLEASGQTVYYAAPAFHTQRELNQSYVAKGVVADSIFVSPKTIGSLPDDKQHHVVFALNSAKNGAYIFSEPRAIDFITGSKLIERLSEEMSSGSSPRSLERLAGEASETMTHLAMEDSDEDRSELSVLSQMSPLEQVAYLSRVYFGCEPFIVRRSPRRV